MDHQLGKTRKYSKLAFKTQNAWYITPSNIFNCSFILIFWLETYVNSWSSHKNPNIFNLALLVGKQCLETNHLFRKCYGSGSLFVSAFHKKTIKIFMNTKPLIRNQMMNHYSVRKTHQHLLCASHVSKSVCAGADCYSSTFLRVFEMHRTSSKSISVWFWQLLTLIWKSLQILTVAFVDFFEMSNVTSDFVCRVKKMSNAKVLIWYYSSKSGVPLLNLFRKFLSGNAIILAHNNLPELFVLYHYLGGAALLQKCPQAHCWKRNFL